MASAPALLSPTDIELLCAAAGWPTPPELHAGRRMDGIVTLRAVSEGQPDWMVQIERRVPWDGSPLYRHLAAEILLTLSPEPRPLPSMVATTELSGGQFAVIRPDAAGLDGSACIAQNPELHDTIATDIGRTLAALEQVPVRRASLGVFRTRFVALGATPADEMRNLAGRAAGLIARAGLDIPSVHAKLVQQVHEGAEAVSTAPVLSHGDLSPSALFYDNESAASLQCIVRWDRAAAALPHRDRARLLDLPASSLARVLDGYASQSSTRPEDWLAEDELACLKAWHALHTLCRMAHIADAMLNSRDPNASRLTEHVTLLAERCIQPDFVAHQLEEANQGATPQASPPSGLRPDPVQANLRQTAVDGARGASHDPSMSQLWSAGLAADLLWLDTPEDQRALLIGVGDAATVCRSRLSTQATSQACAPIPDREAWWDALTRALVMDGDDRAWILLWTLRDADRALRGTLSDSVLRAAEEAMWRQSSLGPEWSDDTPEHRAGRAALAAGAMAALGFPDEAEEWCYRTQDAIDACARDPLAMGQTGSADIAVVLAAMQNRPSKAILAPLLCRALRHVTLPVTPAALTSHVEW